MGIRSPGEMTNKRLTELIARELLENLVPEERDELASALATDPELAKEYQLIREFLLQHHEAPVNAHEALAKVKATIIRLEQDDGTGRVSPVKQLPGKISRFPFVWLAAACLLGITAVLVFRLYSKSNNNQALVWMEKITVNGVRSHLVLADGTKIILNAGSRLEYPRSFNGGIREVRLNGEAFFDVAKDAQHPFIIHTDKMNIKVLGTSFNVKCYGEDAYAETTLVTGAVEITLNGRSEDRITLKPKEKLIVHNKKTDDSTSRLYSSGRQPDSLQNRQFYTLTAAEVLLDKHNRDSVMLETSWLNNQLVFRHEPFTSLARELERRYGVNIYFRNEKIKAYVFSGFFQRESLMEALTELQLSEHFQFRIQGADVYIY